MFAARTICTTCRSRLLAETVAKGASVRHQSTVPAASTFLHSTETTRSNHDATKRHKHVPTHKPISATSERIPRGSNDGNAKRRALDLFESTINSARRSESQAEADTQKLHQIARNIDAILHNARENPEEPYAAALYACVIDDILPLLRQSDSGLLPQFAYSKATEALRAVLDVKVNACDDPTLPRASELCGTLAEIGMKTPGRLDPFLGLLNWLIAKTPAEVNAAGSPSVDSAVFDQHLLEDLLGCWKGLSLSRHAYKARGLDTRRPTPRNPRNISDPLYNCHVEFPLLVSLDPKKLVVVLATTFVLLSDPRVQSAASTEALEAVKKELKVFVQPFDAAKLESHFTANPALWEYVAPRIDWAPLQARIQSKPKQPIEFHSPTKTAHANVKVPTKRISYSAWHKRLSTLFKLNDANGLREAWEELTNPVNDTDRADKLRQCPELFDYVLNQCCSKHGSGGDKFWESFTNQTMEYMNNIGLVPTIRTYTSMMEGWKIAKRLRSVQLLWNQVVESGMELDHHIWSSRISANGALGNPNAGMKVLTEMQAIWEEAVATGTQHKAVKPDISSVNAAISGFLRNDRMSSVQDVLAWANSQRIEPDIFTYNKLLGYMLKKGRMEEADNILSSMKNSGINPDSATFTIILETALAEMSMQDPDAQRVTVRRVFAEMATCGLEPNQQTYAKMLHLLVRSGDGAKVPIEAVLSHLRASGLQPSPQICTILFEYYFSRRPRDWDAIRALITDRRSRTRVLTDRIFWETVMRHFHAAGEVRAALEIFYDMDDWGIWPSLSVLEPILRSLTAAREWEEAQKLVTTVRKQARPLSADPDGRYYKQAFWFVARDCGLMQEEA
ncbi:hypothetical protein D7B24_002019 [Verticillium nonalfalfae]|uniref:Pentacotripeptide-repeat region of PRORP domain-containing protein n=1 Tax=Verticillium nonalfalfae TaxID=1051616 RepID=A0A3M9XYI0_9PEZI|nr:uncharacterized protein D7B24_002019 [Verticillium nonalfalfae]RNJ53317.1 hypothetical protein D7B24_002019 [Verticillium nonalfalfae]